MREHPPRIAIDKSIIAAFEQANPDVKIQYQVIPVAAYGTKLVTAFASGGGPDLFNQFSGLVAQYYHARVIAPIDFAAMGYADAAALTSQYMNGFDGARFGVGSTESRPRSATGSATPTTGSGRRPGSIPGTISPRRGKPSPRLPRN